jgi:hypothetical protein
MRVSRTKLVPGICIAAVLVAGGLLPAAATILPAVHTAGGKSKRPELVKTIPITRHPGSKPRVVVSLPPVQVARLADGDLVRGFGEAEVSVTCTEQMPQCVGRVYHFSPHVAARLYLASKPSSQGGFPIGQPKRLTCSQNYPNRNHHCVLVLDDERRVVSNASSLPCAPARCHLNLVISAYHSGARDGDVVVVGTDQSHGISQGKASVSVAVHRPQQLAAFADQTTRRSSKPEVHSVPVGRHAESRRERVIYSVRLADLSADEQLIAHGDAKLRIASLPYNTLMRSRLILAEHPSSTRSAGIPFGATSGHASFDAANGFNCTQGRSAFSDPCPVRKAGTIRMRYDAVTHPHRGRGSRQPLYVNLVVGMSQEFGGQWHPNDRARVAGGALRVERYPAKYRR